MVQQVWMASAKSQTKQTNAGKQCRKINSTALAQLNQHRVIVLVGAATVQATSEEFEAAGSSYESDGRLWSAAAGDEGKGGGGCRQGSLGEE